MPALLPSSGPALLAYKPVQVLPSHEDEWARSNWRARNASLHQDANTHSVRETAPSQVMLRAETASALDEANRYPTGVMASAVSGDNSIRWLEYIAGALLYAVRENTEIAKKRQITSI